MEIHGYQIASKGTRLLATIVEGIIFLLIMMGIYFIIGKPISEYWNAEFKYIEVIISGISGAFVGAVLYPFFIGNLGHKIFKLKVISVETGEDYKRPENGALREFLKYVLAYLLIPIIWILWDEKNQNLYDKITKTVVVNKTTT